MELLSLESLVYFFLLSISICYLYFKYSSQKKPINTYGFKVYPLLGTIPELLKNRHRFLDWTTEVLSGCPTNTATFRRPGKIQGVITANPINVEHILKTNFENFPKGERFISFFDDFLGRGIFNSDGEQWRVQRKTASYEFNMKSLRHFVVDNVTVEINTSLMPLLTKATQSNQVVDFQDILERFAFDNICKVVFNVDPGFLREASSVHKDLMRAFDHATTLSSGRLMYAFPSSYKIKKLLNIGSEKRLRKSIATVHNFVDSIIQSRIMESKSSENMDRDLLSRFIGNKEFSPKFLRDIIVSFILAGRDTTSSALSWFFWILSSRPDVKQNILNEIEAIRTRNGKNIGDGYDFNELHEMHYLHAALSETLRLYPSIPVDTRACKNDDVLPDGTFVGKGWRATYHTYAMGRMESVWGENCLEFLPERWMKDGVCKAESPFRFPVFHAGPRMCLGKDMAYIQMKLIAASVIERLEVEVLEKDTCPEHLLSLTLRMKDGLRARVRERHLDLCNKDPCSVNVKACTD